MFDLDTLMVCCVSLCIRTTVQVYLDCSLLWHVWQSCSSVLWLNTCPLVALGSPGLPSQLFYVFLALVCFFVSRWIFPDLPKIIPNMKIILESTGIFTVQKKFLSLCSDYVNSLRLSLTFTPCFDNLVLPRWCFAPHFLVMESKAHWLGVILLLCSSAYFPLLLRGKHKKSRCVNNPVNWQETASYTIFLYKFWRLYASSLKFFKGFLLNDYSWGLYWCDPWLQAAFSQK